MKKKPTPAQERVTRLLAAFGRLPVAAQESVIGYTAGVADAAARYKQEGAR